MTPNHIRYHGTLDIRFSDLDTYGHVNSKNYLDFVATTRLRFLDENTAVSSREIVKRGYAFYLKSSQINYRRPISGMARIYVESYVSHRERSDLHIPFSIQSEDKTKIYADGTLIFTVVSFQTGKPAIDVPDWLMELFFSPSEAVHES